MTAQRTLKQQEAENMQSEPVPPVLEDLGALLEARRRQLGKSAREIANGAGISPVYLRVIETGLNPKTGRASRPSAEIIVRLARVLEIGATELLSLAGYSDLRAGQNESTVNDPADDETEMAVPATLEAIADALQLVRTRPSDFMRLVAAEDLASFEAHLTAVAAGSLLCGPADEPRVRKKALFEACQRSLQAVSFQDDPWWLGTHGANYLALHAGLIETAQPADLTRIFLLDPSETSAYTQIFAQHVDIGMEVLVADPSDVPDTCRRDIEIYDRSLLREAASNASRGGGRLAEFTDDHGRLRRAELAFDTVRRAARVATT